ncbi:hypothetical protein [Citreimonas sp.]|uniref:hypothetical protein n=1 Tax=Citreimonas sp. TaxID=3036715 RepID=UPI0035C823D5
MPAIKVATCTYCGTRAALVLSGQTRHELACSACGAPLHDLKMLRADADHAPRYGRAPDRAMPDRPRKAGRRDKAKGLEAVALGLLGNSRLKRKLLKKAIKAAGDIFD